VAGCRRTLWNVSAVARQTSANAVVPNIVLEEAIFRRRNSAQFTLIARRIAASDPPTVSLSCVNHRIRDRAKSRSGADMFELRQSSCKCNIYGTRRNHDEMFAREF
jgi:hypothetical protein